MTTAQKVEIKKAVNAALREILSDPDYVLELTAAFKRRLIRARKEIEKGRTSDLREFLKSSR